MVYTLGEASKATGRSKSTISKAIKSGRISAKKGETGAFAIDPSELHRVYPAIVESEQNRTLQEASLRLDYTTYTRLGRHRLCFDGWVPPRVQQEHFTG